ncbi:hypothetical protein [Streptomyces sp. NBC_00582]|uniref:hypothetical protein n=1 Tax=Streptomyces sp. NBC_00582 TaxID=2975783 RepID=UPI002E817313|nr:hypothetical protein [Streptomyces sp. NBC_00582]WUB60889.1 hypothetical protein OG852_11070 [Streptomyces sp. NBC_00582]
MIPRVHVRRLDAAEALADALDRPASDQEGLTGHTVIAHWPGLDDYTTDEQPTWTSEEWANHLDAPSREHPFAAGPRDDRFAIWHADVRLAPVHRHLTAPEWSEIAHRLARAAGIVTPGDTNGCRWIAVQAQPRRLDLIANLICPDGTWTTQPDLLRRLVTEYRRLETDLGLLQPFHAPPAPHTTAAAHPAAAPTAVGAAAQLAQLLHQLADEATGPLATVRGLVEHAAHRLGALPDAYGPVSEHQLDWIARRLLSIQQDLGAVADLAATPHRTAPAPALPLAHPTATSARPLSTP